LFPVSSEVISVLQFALFFAFSALSISAAFRSKLFVLLPIGILIAVSVWHLENYERGWEGFARVIQFVFLVVLLTASGLWVLALRFIIRKLTAARKNVVWGGALPTLAVFPAVAISLHALFFQYVPASICTKDSIKISIGERNFTLRRSYSSMIRTVKTPSNTASQLIYSTEAKDKTDLGTVCKFSENGQARIAVSDLWVHPQNILSGSNMDWKSNDSIHIVERSEFFSGSYGISSKQIEAISELKMQPDVLAGGDSFAGHLCRDEHRDHGDGFYCHVWRQADPDTIIVMSMHNNVGVSQSEVLKQIIDDLDGSVSILSE